MCYLPPSCVFGSHYIPQRYVVSFMLFLGITMVFSTRMIFSIAVTDFVGKQPSEVQNNSKCSWYANQLVAVKRGPYNMSGVQEAITQCVYFPAYGMLDILAGFFNDSFGGKWSVGLLILLSIFPSFAFNQFISLRWFLALAEQVLLGIIHGMILSNITAMLARWVPKRERGTVGSLVLSASHMGYLIAYLMMTYVWNWKIVFYVWGGISLVWFPLYCVLCYSEPSHHKRITEEEGEMLRKEIGSLTKEKIPWKSMLRHPGFYGIIIGQWGHDYIFFLLANSPKYLKHVFKFNIKQQGYLIVLPYVVLFISAIISGIISDVLINKQRVTVTFIRKLYSTIASVGPSVCCVVAAYVGCNRKLAAAMLILGMFLMGPYYSGMRVNAMDITLNFCGVVTALANGSGALIYSPMEYWINLIIHDPMLSHQWKYVVWTAFGMSTLSTISYLILGSGERAKWDED